MTNDRTDIIAAVVERAANIEEIIKGLPDAVRPRVSKPCHHTGVSRDGSPIDFDQFDNFPNFGQIFPNADFDQASAHGLDLFYDWSDKGSNPPPWSDWSDHTKT